MSARTKTRGRLITTLHVRRARRPGSGRRALETSRPATLGSRQAAGRTSVRWLRHEGRGSFVPATVRQDGLGSGNCQVRRRWPRGTRPLVGSTWIHLLGPPGVPRRSPVSDEETHQTCLRLARARRARYVRRRNGILATGRPGPARPGGRVAADLSGRDRICQVVGRPPRGFTPRDGSAGPPRSRARARRPSGACAADGGRRSPRARPHRPPRRPTP